MKLYIYEPGKTDADYPPDEEGRMVIWMRSSGNFISIDAFDSVDKICEDETSIPWGILEIDSRGIKLADGIKSQDKWPLDNKKCIRSFRMNRNLD